MAYYDALVAKWATLTGTTNEKLAAVNALTVAGPNVDVPVSSVVGVLMLSGAYLTLAQFASGSTPSTALGAAKMLMAMLTLPNAPAFGMSVPSTYAAIKAMMDAILAQETSAPGTTGFTQSVHDALLALAATTVPWWTTGYTSPISQSDLDAVPGGLT